MKQVLCIALLAVCALFASAQSNHKTVTPHAEFGIKGGLNIANLHVENSTNQDAKASFYLGGLAHIHVTKFFAVQPEIMYSGQGFNQTIDDTKYRARLSYINMPVLAQFMFGDGFRLESGPQLGVLAAARQKAGSSSTDVKDLYKPLDFSWVFGLGYVTPSGFGVDARYNLGINNINDVSANKVNNRVFAAGVFYQFGTK